KQDRLEKRQEEAGSMINQIGLLRFLKIIILHPVKLINLFQVGISYVFLNGKMWGIPPVLMLEVSTFCQLRCPLCIREDPEFSRSNKNIDISLIKKFLEKYGRRLCVVLLYNQGEPFLHPEFLEIVKLFKKYDCFVKVSTNGNYKNIDPHAIVSSGLDHIIFDVDGDDQETYEKYRVGGSLKTVIDNIGSLCNAKKELRSGSPYIEARLIAFSHNIHRIDSVNALLKSLAIDAFTVKKSLIRDEKTFKGSSGFIPDRFNRLKGKRPKSCFYLWVYFCILIDGSLSPCCYDELGRVVLGNFSNDLDKDIFNAQEYIGLRKKVKAGPETLALCKGCDIEEVFYKSYENFRKVYAS
ncbi:MAG TPA: radical SAM protein, partial [Candidatus Omnitrophota bacterium]|nr:radical SAM protein [Candidatus Omnitrophota bacterium]